MMKLRALEPSDLDLLYNVENDSGLWQYSETTVPFSRDALLSYILTCSNDFFQDKQLRLIVEQDGCAIGIVDLCNFSPLHSRAEVSIAILPDEQGKGLGTEALRQLVQYASRFLHLHQLFAYVSIENLPSLRAFSKAGFTQTGTLRGWIRLQDSRFVDAAVFQVELD